MGCAWWGCLLGLAVAVAGLIVVAGLPTQVLAGWSQGLEHDPARPHYSAADLAGVQHRAMIGAGVGLVLGLGWVVVGRWRDRLAMDLLRLRGWGVKCPRRHRVLLGGLTGVAAILGAWYTFAFPLYVLFAAVPMAATWAWASRQMSVPRGAAEAGVCGAVVVVAAAFTVTADYPAAFPHYVGDHHARRTAAAIDALHPDARTLFAGDLLADPLNYYLYRRGYGPMLVSAPDPQRLAEAQRLIVIKYRTTGGPDGDADELPTPAGPVMLEDTLDLGSLVLRVYRIDPAKPAPSP